MKKIILSLLFIFTFVALTPFVGDYVITQELLKKEQEFTKIGLKITQKSTQNTYLNTTKNYTLKVNDTQLFKNYLDTYHNAFLSKVFFKKIQNPLFLLHITYSKLLENKKIALSLELIDTNASTVSQKKMQLHATYDIANESYKGELELFKLHYSGVKISPFKTSFQGKESLLFPQNFTTHTKNLKTTFQNILFHLVNLQSIFIQKAPYTQKQLASVSQITLSKNKTKLELFNIHSKETKYDHNQTFTSQNTNSIESIHLSLNKDKFTMKEFFTQISISKIDKTSYETVKQNLNNGSSKPFALFSKGLEFEVKQFQAKSVLNKDGEDLGGFAINADFKLKADPKFEQKLKTLPLLLIANIDFTLKAKISRELFALFVHKYFGLNVAKFELDSYVKYDKKFAYLDIEFHNQELYIHKKKRF